MESIRSQNIRELSRASTSHSTQPFSKLACKIAKLCKAWTHIAARWRLPWTRNRTRSTWQRAPSINMFTIRLSWRKLSMGTATRSSRTPSLISFGRLNFPICQKRRKNSSFQKRWLRRWKVVVFVMLSQNTSILLTSRGKASQLRSRTCLTQMMVTKKEIK